MHSSGFLCIYAKFKNNVQNKYPKYHRNIYKMMNDIQNITKVYCCLSSISSTVFVKIWICMESRSLFYAFYFAQFVSNSASGYYRRHRMQKQQRTNKKCVENAWKQLRKCSTTGETFRTGVNNYEQCPVYLLRSVQWINNWTLTQNSRDRGIRYIRYLKADVEEQFR